MEEELLVLTLQVEVEVELVVQEVSVMLALEGAVAIQQFQVQAMQIVLQEEVRAVAQMMAQAQKTLNLAVQLGERAVDLEEALYMVAVAAGQLVQVAERGGHTLQEGEVLPEPPMAQLA